MVLLESVHEVDELALGRVYVLLGSGVHVQQEVEESKNLGIYIPLGEIGILHLKVNAVLILNELHHHLRSAITHP